MRTFAALLLLAACAPPPPHSTLAPEVEEATPAPPSAKAGARSPRLTRAALTAALDAGPGAFLGRVKLRAVVTGGRFVGWEVLEMDPAFGGAGVRTGDVVERVNGHPVEKPDDFAAAWQALRGVDAIELTVRRAGDESVVRVPVDE